MVLVVVRILNTCVLDFVLHLWSGSEQSGLVPFDLALHKRIEGNPTLLSTKLKKKVLVLHAST
jgi:hypothetical protein